ncbi:MAG: hypothetical protein AB2L20_09890 [Mangrovibacterium sp.]
MRSYVNKQVLLIAPVLYNYHLILSDAITKNGGQVTFIPERRYNTIFVFLKYLSRHIQTAYSNDHLRKKIAKAVSEKKFDTVILIRGERITLKILQLVKKANPRARFIYYQWDSFRENPNAANIYRFFDKVFTFDRNDSREKKLNYLPLFYSNENRSGSSPSEPIKYDLVFVGGDHTDRYTIVKKLRKNLTAQNKQFHVRLVTTKLSLMKKKLLYRKKFGRINDNDFVTTPFSPAQIAVLMQQSIAVLDINNPVQSGLTMRTIETLATGKKIVTTNPFIQYEPFYNPGQILVIDRENCAVPGTFFTDQQFENTVKHLEVNRWVNYLIQ